MRVGLGAHFCSISALTFVCFTIFPNSATSQVASAHSPSNILTVASKDQRALALVSQALNAANASAWSRAIDFQLSAETTIWNGVSQQHRLTISGKSNGKYRFDVDAGHYLMVRSGTTAWSSRDQGATQSVPTWCALSDAIYFAVPHLWDIVNDPQINISYKGPAVIDGTPVTQIEVTRVLPADKNGNPSHLSQFTTKTLSFDSASGTLLQISDRVYSAHNALSSLTRTIDFADYRVDQGILFPHKVTEHQRLQLLNVFTFDKLTLNQGLQDAYFVITQ